MKCFFLEPTDRVAESLRRYKGSQTKCSCTEIGYHDAEVYLGEREARKGDSSGDNHPHGDPRWPKACACGYVFEETDEWQHRAISLYKRGDTGELITLRNAPVGAMWFATWYSDQKQYCGDDGNTLVVMLPGKKEWMVDSRCSNCDSPCARCGKPYHAHPGSACSVIPAGTPYNKEHYFLESRPHKCWVRHGTVPNIHVDKNGVTCGAGAGSISVPGYHGFLHNGELTNC